jgi:hypothetical protein
MGGGRVASTTCVMSPLQQEALAIENLFVACC